MHVESEAEKSFFSLSPFPLFFALFVPEFEVTKANTHNPQYASEREKDSTRDRNRKCKKFFFH